MVRASKKKCASKPAPMVRSGPAARCYLLSAVILLVCAARCLSSAVAGEGAVVGAGPRLRLTAEEQRWVKLQGRIKYRLTVHTSSGNLSALEAGEQQHATFSMEATRQHSPHPKKTTHAPHPLSPARARACLLYRLGLDTAPCSVLTCSLLQAFRYTRSGSKNEDGAPDGRAHHCASGSRCPGLYQR